MKNRALLSNYSATISVTYLFVAVSTLATISVGETHSSACSVRCMRTFASGLQRRIAKVTASGKNADNGVEEDTGMANQLEFSWKNIFSSAPTARLERRRLKFICKHYRTLNTCVRSDCAEPIVEELVSKNWAVIDFVCVKKWDEFRKNIVCLKKEQSKISDRCRHHENVAMAELHGFLTRFHTEQLRPSVLTKFCEQTRAAVNCIVPLTAQYCTLEAAAVVADLFEATFRNIRTLFIRLGIEQRLPTECDFFEIKHHSNTSSLDLEARIAAYGGGRERGKHLASGSLSSASTIAPSEFGGSSLDAFFVPIEIAVKNNNLDILRPLSSETDHEKSDYVSIKDILKKTSPNVTNYHSTEPGQPKISINLDLNNENPYSGEMANGDKRTSDEASGITKGSKETPQDGLNPRSSRAGDLDTDEYIASNLDPQHIEYIDSSSASKEISASDLIEEDILEDNYYVTEPAQLLAMSKYWNQVILGLGGHKNYPTVYELADTNSKSSKSQLERDNSVYSNGESDMLTSKLLPVMLLDAGETPVSESKVDNIGDKTSKNKHRQVDSKQQSRLPQIGTKKYANEGSRAQWLTWNLVSLFTGVILLIL